MLVILGILFLRLSGVLIVNPASKVAFSIASLQIS